MPDAPAPPDPAPLPAEPSHPIDVQLRAILNEDKSRSKNLTVIVQMEAPPVVPKSALEALIREAQRLQMLQNPRDALPPPAPRSRAKSAAGARANALAKLGLASLGVDVDAGKAIDAGRKALQPILSNPRVKSWSRALGAEKKTAPAPVPLEASRCAVLVVPKDELGELRKTPGIRAVFPNRVVRLPPMFEDPSTPQAVEDVRGCTWGLHRIGAPAVWGAFGVRGKGAKVAVLDTGIDATHPDLAGKIDKKDWAEFDENGAEVPDSEPHDTSDHGTHCAGTIAGGNASGRWIGVAPDAKLAGGLVIPNGAGTLAQIFAGMNWAIKHRVDVISMSLGGLTFDAGVGEIFDDTLFNAYWAGIPVVASIGNFGNQTTGGPGNALSAFAVGATDYRDRVAGLSGGRTHFIRDSGSSPEDPPRTVYQKPDISAPGVHVLSAVPGTSHAYFSGTSMAAPHVAGAMALLLSAFTSDHERNDRLVALLEALLRSSVEDLGESGQDQRYGLGRLDVFRAVGLLRAHNL